MASCYWSARCTTPGFEIDQYVGRGELKRGSNLILVKICQNEQMEDWAQTWAFRLRVCDSRGTAVLAKNRAYPARRLRTEPQSRQARVVGLRNNEKQFIPMYLASSRLGGLLVVVVVLTVGTTRADWLAFPRRRDAALRPDQRPPLKWNVETGENIAWKIRSPGKGVSGPIVVGDNVIVTASSGPRERAGCMCCASTPATGKERWSRQFWATGSTLCNPMTAVACNTPASDGERIYAQFSSNDLVCLDLAGNLVWFRGLNFDYPAARNDTGMASSPVVVGDTVVVQSRVPGRFVCGRVEQAHRRRPVADRARRAAELVVAVGASR